MPLTPGCPACSRRGSRYSSYHHTVLCKQLRAQHQQVQKERDPPQAEAELQEKRQRIVSKSDDMALEDALKRVHEEEELPEDPEHKRAKLVEALYAEINEIEDDDVQAWQYIHEGWDAAAVKAGDMRELEG
eukprot:7272893-Lingulodinium_polyedra.AAC.1